MYSGIKNFEREVVSVSYWEGVKLVSKPANPDLISKLLIQSNHERSNAIVTAEGKMYLSFDVPGYSDGDSTVIKMI